MLRIAAVRDTTANAHLAPLFDGRVGTIAEAERLVAPTATNHMGINQWREQPA
jgi:hypothetical protein